MNNRLLAGIAMVIAGVLVLIFPEFLRIIVGVGLLIAGLWLALQNAPTGGGGNI